MRWSWSSERIPSCIREPPEATSETSGWRATIARSKAPAILRPVASPIEPPMWRKSKAISSASTAPTRAVPQTTDSGSPERLRARSRWAA